MENQSFDAAGDGSSRDVFEYLFERRLTRLYYERQKLKFCPVKCRFWCDTSQKTTKEIIIDGFSQGKIHFWKRKQKVTIYTSEPYHLRFYLNRRTSFELDIFTNLNKIDIFPSEVPFIEASGEKYTVRKNLEDLYYVVLTQDGGKVVDNFLRVLFTWTTEGEVTDVKVQIYTLRRV